MIKGFPKILDAKGLKGLATNVLEEEEEVESTGDVAEGIGVKEYLIRGLKSL